MNRVCLFWSIVFALWVSPQLVGQEATTTNSRAIPATDEGLPGAGPIRRQDWFQNLWNTRRTQFAARTAQEQNAVVFYGDSITQSWSNANLGAEKLENAFKDMKVANRGISGDTTRGMLIRLKDDVLSLKPSAVVLLMGTNDLEEKAEPETIAGNVKLILSELHKHNEDMPIILCLVMPSSETKSRPAAKIKKLNELYAGLVKEDKRVTVVDTWTLFADAAGDAKTEEFPDLLHPNALGYKKWNAALRPVFATLNLSQPEVDTFEIEPGFVSLFNGKDLTGWGLRPTPEDQLASRKAWQERDRNAPPWPVVTEPISFDGKTASPDGRFVANNGRLIVTTPSEGRKIQMLYTTRDFPNDFTLKLEFRATPNADSGIFVRGPQLQCRDYVLAGPYKELKNYKPQDWNEIEVKVKDGIAHCTCNGEVLEAMLKVPATGPIGLEGDRGQMEYRRIRIKEEGGNLLKPTELTTTWTFESRDRGKGSMSSAEGAIVLQTTETGDENWHVQAYQNGLTLKEGGKYILKFKIKSPEQVNTLLVAQVHGSDWHEIGLHEDISTEKEYREMTIPFTAAGIVDGVFSRIGFVIGSEKGTIMVKDMTLTEATK